MKNPPMCSMHYTRLRRYGDVGEGTPRHVKGLSLAERFVASLRPVRAVNGCLEATAGIRDRDGYPLITYQRKPMRGGRAALTIAGYPPPFAGAHACHRCDNRACVDYEHLYWGTLQDNTADRVERGKRWVLADEVVDELRRLHEQGVPLREIQRRTGVTRSTIKRRLGLPMSPAHAKTLAKSDPRRIEV